MTSAVEATTEIRPFQAEIPQARALADHRLGLVDADTEHRHGVSPGQPVDDRRAGTDQTDRIGQPDGSGHIRRCDLAKAVSHGDVGKHSVESPLGGQTDRVDELRSLNLGPRPVLLPLPNQIRQRRLQPGFDERLGASVGLRPVGRQLSVSICAHRWPLVALAGEHERDLQTTAFRRPSHKRVLIATRQRGQCGHEFAAIRGSHDRTVPPHPSQT